MVDQIVAAGALSFMPRVGRRDCSVARRPQPGTPASTMNFVDPYLKMILGFIGVTEAMFVTTGGAAQVMTGAVDREALLKPTLERVRSVAA
jgi:FMN-dependent NADH-azoreductase